MFRRFDELLVEVAGFIEESNPTNILTKVTNDLVYTATQLIGIEKCCMKQSATLLVVDRKAYLPTECMAVEEVKFEGLPLFEATVVRNMQMRPSLQILPGQILLNFDADCLEIDYWMLPTDDCGKILIPEVIYETAVAWSLSQQMKSPRMQRIHGVNMWLNYKNDALRAATRAKNQIDRITPMQLRTLMSTIHGNFYSHHDRLGATEI